MKFTAGILSFLIICMFAIQTTPHERNLVESQSENVTKSCCENHNNPTENDDSGCCNNCNPFMHCCSMMGFIIQSPLKVYISTVKIKNEKLELYNYPISHYTNEIWQPPKV